MSILRKNIFVFLLLLLAFSPLASSKSASLIYQKYELTNSNSETLYFYLGHKPNTQNLNSKLMVFIQGSGHDSITSRFSKFDWESIAFKNGFDLLFMEKFAFNDKKLFSRTDCRERRISDIETVINYIVTTVYNGKIDNICLFSGSEGGTIAPELALRINKVTSLIIFGGGGYPQSKDFVILLQKELNNGKGFFLRAGIKQPGKLQAWFEEIKKNSSTEKLWLGHTYKYWNSYLWYSPEEYITKLTIPTLFIIGDADDNTPAESVAYLIPLLKDKPNFAFHILPGLDHSFKDSGGHDKMNDTIQSIVIPWLLELNKI